MSQVIDRKVVEMEFDNSKFDSNVKQSMSTLDELKKNLNLEKSAESFKEISKAANNVSFDGMKKGIEDVNVHFTKLEAAVKRIVENITDDLYKLGKNMAKSLSIDQVTSGFKQYEDKTNSVQTIMNATGESIDAVDERLNKLIWYADETSYSFNDMVGSLGKFTSAGVDIDKATNAMMGISNWAAESGVNARDATRAFYNLSQAMGSGVVKRQDWISIEQLNMNTRKFHQTVIDTAIALGKLDSQARTIGKGTQITAENLGQNLTEGWFTSDVLIASLDKYSKYTDLVYQRVQETGENCAEAMKWVSEHMSGSYDEIGESAFEAGQEAKTFTDAIDAVKDAVKSKWANIFEGLFGNYEEAKETFTSMSNSLYTVFAEPLDDFNSTLKEALGPKSISMTEFKSMYKDMREELGMTGSEWTQFEEVLKQVARDSGVDIDEIIRNSSGSFEASLEKGWLTTDLFQKAVTAVEEGTTTSVDKLSQVQDLVHKIWEGEYGVGEERRKALEDLGYSYDEIQALVDKGYEYEVTLEDLDSVTQGFFNTTGEGLDSLKEKLANADTVESFKELAKYMSGKDLRNGILDNLFNDDYGAVVTYVTTIRDAFHDIFGTLDSGAIHDFLADIYARTSALLNEDRVERFKKVVENVFHAIHTGLNLIKGAFSVVAAVWNNTLGPLVSGLWNIIKSIANGLGNLFARFDQATSETTAFATAVQWLNDKLEPVKRMITAATDGIARFIDSLFSGKDFITSFIEAVDHAIDKFFGSDKEGVFILQAEQVKESFHKIMEGLSEAKDTLVKTVKHIRDKLTEAYEYFQNTELGQAIGRVIENIRTTISELWTTVTDWIKEKLHIEDSDFDFFESFQTAFDNFNTWLDNLDLESGIQKISDFAMNIKNKVKGAFESVTNWFENNEVIQGAISTIKEKFGELKDSVTSAMDSGEGEEKEPFLTRVLNGLKAALQWFLDNLPSIDEVIGMIGTIIGSAAFVNLIRMIKTVKDMFTGGAGFVTNINEVLRGLASALKGFAFEKFAKGALEFAAAIFLVSVALFGLSLIEPNRLLTAGAAIAVVASSIGLLALGIGKLMEAMGLKKQSEAAAALDNAKAGFEGAKTGLINSLSNIGNAISGFITNMGTALTKSMMITSYAKLLVGLAIALGVLAAAVYFFAQMDIKKLGQGVVAVVALVGTLAGAMKLMTAGTSSEFSIGKGGLTSSRKGAGAAGTGFGLLGMAFAIMLLVETIDRICRYNLGELAKGVITIGVIMAEMTAFTHFGGNIKFSTGLSLVMFAVMVEMFVGIIGQLSHYNFGQIMTAVLAIGIIVGEMVLFTKKVGNLKEKGMGSLIAVGIAMMLFCESIKGLTHYSWDKLLVAVLAFGAIMVEVVLFTKKMQDIKFSKGTASTLVSVGAMMLLFTASIKMLAKEDWPGILVAMGALAGVMVSVVLFSKQMQNIQFSKGTALTLGAMAVAIIAFSAALMLLGQVPWQNLLAGMGALIGIMAGATGMAYLLSMISGNLKDIGIFLAGAAALIAAVAAAIWLVSKALDGIDIEQVRFNLSELVVGAIQDLVNTIVGSVDTIVGGIVDLLGSILEHADEIVNMAIDLIVKLLNILTQRMPELATAIAEFVKALISSFATAFEGVDLTPLANAFQNMLIAVGAIVLLGHFGGFGAALKGLGMFTLVLGGLIAVFTGLAALLDWIDNDQHQLGENLKEGFSFLTDIAEGIGDFIGTLVGSVIGSFAESFTDSLPAIGANLSAFMNNVQPFLDGASRIDDTFLAGVGFLTLALLEITGANFIDSIMDGLSWLVGGGDSTSFMAKFKPLGEALAGFANAIKDVDFSAVEGAQNAAAVIETLINVAPREGGLLQMIIGGVNLESFAGNLAVLGQGVGAFCDAVAGKMVDSSTVETAAAAIQMLVDVAPKEGGIWQQITGTADLGNFGANLGILGKGVGKFCSYLTDVDIDSKGVEAAAAAIQMIVDVAPSSGGLWQKITGEKDLGAFARNLGSLGLGVKNFCMHLQGIIIDSKTVTSATTAIKNVVDIVPSTGGLWQKITGEKDLGKFAENLGKLGLGVKNFCMYLQGIIIDAPTVESATTAIKNVVDIVPSTGGLWQKITGEQDLGNFASNLGSLGLGVKNFCMYLQGIVIDAPTVGSAVEAIEALVNMAPSTDGIWQTIAGENDLGKFGDNLGILGQGVAAYMDATKDVTKDQALHGITAAAGVIEVMKLSWPKTGGLWNWLKSSIIAGSTDFNDLKDTLIAIAEMAVSLKDGFADVSSSDLTNAKDSAQAVIDILNLPWPTEGGILQAVGQFLGLTEGDTNFNVLGETLGAIATALTGFSTDVSGVSYDNVSSAKESATIIIGLLTALSSDLSIDDSKISSRTGDMGTVSKALSDFSSDVTGIDSALITTACGSIKEIIDTIVLMANVDFDKATSFSDALGDLAGTGVSKFTDTFENAKKDTDTAVSTFIDNVVLAIDESKVKFINAGHNSVKTYSEGINSVYSNAKVKTAIDTLLSNAAAVINDTTSFTTAAEENVKAYGNVFASDSSVQTKARGLAKAAARELYMYDDYYNTGWNCIVGFNNGFIGAAGDFMYTNIYNVGVNALNEFKNATGVASPSTKFREAAEYCIEGAVLGFSDSANDLANASAEAGEESVNAMTMNDLFRKLGEDSVSAYLEAFDYAKNAVIAEVLRALVVAICTELFNNNADEYRRAGEESANSFASAFVITDTIKESFNGFTGTISEELYDNNSEKYSDAGLAAVSGFLSQFVFDPASEGYQTVEDFLTDVCDLMHYGREDRFRGAGAAAVEGFVNGFKEGADSELYGTVGDVAYYSAEAFDEELGIASPSKRYAESAKYCILGAVQGFKDNAYLLSNEVESVGTNSVDAMKLALSGLDFTDLDDAPVIRPVLDLSAIQNGSGLIDSMLDKEGMLSLNSGESLRLANSIDKQAAITELNGVYNDAAVIQSIAQLGERVDALNEAILSMGFYLDGKQLVGGIVRDMDDALGNLSSKKNAGVL